MLFRFVRWKYCRLENKKHGSEKGNFVEQRRIFSDVLLLKNSFWNMMNFKGKDLIFFIDSWVTRARGTWGRACAFVRACMDGELHQKEPWDRKCVKGKWRQANWAVYLRVGKFFSVLLMELLRTVYCKL